MANEQVNEGVGSSAETARGRSTIDFSYTPLDDAEAIASAVYQVGGTACDWDQLATRLNQASKGGGFRLRVSGARIFGLLTADRGRIELTDLGIRILDPKHVRAARVTAFLHVPLHKQVFDRIKGQVLPPPTAIERMMEGMGVAPKQKEKARQVFMRSAKTAGFFELSSERLTMPPNVNTDQSGGADGNGTGAGQLEKPKKEGAGSGGGDTPDMHPFIRGLLDKLPPPNSDWPEASRAKWLQTAANIFDLIYTINGEEGGSDISVKPNPKRGSGE